MTEVDDAEMSVAGAVLLSPSAYEVSGLRPDHFFNPKVAAVWDAMGKLRAQGKPIDELMLEAELSEAGKLEAVGGLPFLSEMAIRVPTAANASHYADIVRAHWLRREVQKAASLVLTQAKLGSPGEELLEALRTHAERIVRESDQDTPTLLDVIQEQQEVIKGGGLLKGLPTGIGIEKYAPGGIPRNKVTMLFADTGTFKTTICNHMKITMAMHSHRVLDCSLEDDSELTAHRYLSRESGVPYGRIASGELSDAERQRLGFLDPGKLEIARNIVAGDTVAPRIKDIIRKAQQLKAQGGLSAVFIDYIQLLEGRKTEKETIDEAIREAQIASKQMKTAFIFVSQQKQDVIDRDDPRPRKEDMMGSSAMKNGAKLAIGLFRPSNHYSHPADQSKAKPKDRRYGEALYSKIPQELYPSMLEAWVLKNVLGTTGACLLEVDAPTGMVRSYPPSRASH